MKYLFAITLFLLTVNLFSQEVGETRTDIIPVQDSMFIIVDTTFQENFITIKMSVPIDSGQLKALFYNEIQKAYEKEATSRKREYQSRRNARNARNALGAILEDDYINFISAELNAAYEGRWKVGGAQTEFITFDSSRRGKDDNGVLVYKITPYTYSLIKLRNIKANETVELVLVDHKKQLFVGKDSSGRNWRMVKID